MMAEGLAEYFEKPVSVFMKEPEYAGNKIKCWEYTHCGQPACPAYGNKENRCWLVHATHCEGMKIAAYPEKVAFCKGCDIIKNLILKPEGYSSVNDKSGEGEAADKKIILAIDDNPEAIDLIRKYLGYEYRVVGVSNGEEAVERAKEIKPIAITLDIMMPKKDGWQVLKELKSTPETQDIPVIILSIVDNKKLGFSLGAAEYIVKPLDKTVLLQKLRNFEKISKIRKILVVDNDYDAAALISSMLGEEGYQATTAFNSKDAIKSIQASIPDLIVLNLSMPEVSSFDVIEYIKKEETVKNIPLIVLTHKDFSENEFDDLNGRIQGVLKKGILVKEDFLKELKDTISRLNE
jgi:CheY-like chemotaxis protein